MQTDVNAVAVSAPLGTSFSGRMRKSGTTFLNHGSVDVRFASH
jgi:hypothetical protein